MRFCQKHNLHLITDEIYALSTWKNPDFPNAPGFTSVLSIKKDGLIDPSLVHVLWGMSKVLKSSYLDLIGYTDRSRTSAPTVSDLAA